MNELRELLINILSGPMCMKYCQHGFFDMVYDRYSCTCYWSALDKPWRVLVGKEIIQECIRCSDIREGYESEEIHFAELTPLLFEVGLEI